MAIVATLRNLMRINRRIAVCAHGVARREGNVECMHDGARA